MITSDIKSAQGRRQYLMSGDIEQSLETFPLNPNDTVIEVFIIEDVPGFVADLPARQPKLKDIVFHEPRHLFRQLDWKRKKP